MSFGKTGILILFLDIILCCFIFQLLCGVGGAMGFSLIQIFDGGVICIVAWSAWYSDERRIKACWSPGYAVQFPNRHLKYFTVVHTADA